MKSSTVWIIIAVIVFIGIIALVNRIGKMNASPVGTILTNPDGSREVVTGQHALGVKCPPPSFWCSRDNYGCCSEEARTTQKDFCERHGGTWTGTQCTYYAQPDMQRHTITTVVTPSNGTPSVKNTL